MTSLYLLDQLLYLLVGYNLCDKEAVQPHWLINAKLDNFANWRQLNSMSHAMGPSPLDSSILSPVNYDGCLTTCCTSGVESLHNHCAKIAGKSILLIT